MSAPKKYRAWDKKLNEWYGSSNDNSLIFYGFSLIGECTVVQGLPVDYLQYLEFDMFTGKKDFEGVEIYEGDILRYDATDGSGYDLYVVEWDNDNAGFHAVWINDNKRMNPENLADTEKDMIVVGNIHKDKEMLNVKENVS